MPGDLLKDEYITELVAKAAAFGGGKIRIIVNNAGFTWDAASSQGGWLACSVLVGPALSHSSSVARCAHGMSGQWDTIVNLHGTVPFKIVREAAPFFRVKDGEPRNIINISSTSGLHGNAGQLNYALAKAGVTGLTKTIARSGVLRSACAPTPSPSATSRPA